MTTLQITVIIIWIVLDLLWSFFSLRDLVKGQFIVKNNGPNFSTVFWVVANFTGLVVLTMRAF